MISSMAKDRDVSRNYSKDIFKSIDKNDFYVIYTGSNVFQPQINADKRGYFI